MLISILSSEIVVLVHDIGGEGFNAFSEVNNGEMIKDVPVRDSDIINCVTPITDPYLRNTLLMPTTIPIL